MKKITDISQLDLNKTYSYADYLTWQFEQSVELVKGKVLQMSPAPKVRHQKIAGNIHGFLWNFFRDKSSSNCQLFAAPFDVRLFDKKKSKGANQDVFTVVIIEILSKGNSKKEMRIKYDLYEEAGVIEYWVIDPEREHLQQFILNSDNIFFLKKTFISEDMATSHIFPDFELDLMEVFAE